MKVALVHDWLTGMRGGEKVLERIARMHPEAPIYTLLWNRGSISPELEAHPIHTSFVQGLPEAATRYRWYLPMFPAAIERFDLSSYDVVLSTSHCVAKSVRTGPRTFHLSYVHTPMRHIWELDPQYFPPGRFPWPASWYVRQTCARLRVWDTRTATRPTALLCNSRFIADRIRRHWGRDADVVYPPVEVGRFRPEPRSRDYYLLSGAFAPYKRGELAIEACRRLGRRLVVAGSGQEERKLRSLMGPEVEFRGWVEEDALPDLYAGARALLFPGEEDFGIMPVEAMACGCPVIALGRGGVLETVGRDAGPGALARVEAGQAALVGGGVLFGRQSVEGICEAILAFEGARFDPAALRARAQPFDAAAFDREYQAAFLRHHEAWRGERSRAIAAPAPA